MMNKTLFIPLRSSNEDAKPVSEGGFLGVADGLGGRGGRKITSNNGVQNTHAFFGSRATLRYARKYFSDEKINSIFQRLYDEDEDTVLKETAGELGREIAESLLRIWSSDKNKHDKWITDGTFRILPTTLALILWQEQEKYADTVSFWAGDSRCYALTKNGLQQLSTDDLMSNEDYQNLLHGDDIMSNYISLSQDFHISARRCRIPIPCLLFSASDGAFMYVRDVVSNYEPNAMQLEYMLLEAFEGKELDKGLDQIKSYYYTVQQDDISMAFALVQNEQCVDFQSMIQERRSTFQREFSDEWTLQKKEYLNIEYCAEAEQAFKEAERAYRNDLGGKVKELLLEDHEILQEYPKYADWKQFFAQWKKEKEAEQNSLSQQLVQVGAEVQRMLVLNWTELRDLGEGTLSEEAQNYVNERRDDITEDKLNDLKKKKDRLRTYIIKLEALKNTRREIISENEWMDAAIITVAPDEKTRKEQLTKFSRNQGYINVQLQNIQRSQVELDEANKALLTVLYDNTDSPASHLMELMIKEAEVNQEAVREISPVRVSMDKYICIQKRMRELAASFSEQEKEKKNALIEELCLEPDGLIDYLSNKRFGDEALIENLDKAAEKWKTVRHLHNLYDEQWEDYKKTYEYYMDEEQFKLIRSDPVHTEGADKK